MTLNFKSEIENLDGIYTGLFSAAEAIYAELKKGSGLKFTESSNETGDAQIGLDVIADDAFFKHLSAAGNVKYVVSEERPDMDKISDGQYSVALDPLDGSKAALVGIPSGAIFGVFKSVETEHDLNGRHIVSGGFFVFGMHLEAYFADGSKVYKAMFKPETSDWDVFPMEHTLPTTRFCAVNASNQTLWPKWFQEHYASLLDTKGGQQKPYNLRWYGSMVSEIKRLIIEGGLFAYPGDARKGYENGHLRLVYEAIPMAFLIKAMGGASTNGDDPILDVPVEGRHQQTPVFIGEKEKIAALVKAKSNAK